LRAVAVDDVSFGSPIDLTRPNRRPPLRGIRVLDIATLFAAPFAAALLADFGAEVIKVELPGSGDALRRLAPRIDGEGAHFQVSARGKKSVTVDLHRPEGQEIIRRLVRVSDVLIENYRPGTLERWNLAYEQLKLVNPRLIMHRVTGYGQTGPYASKAGFGMTVQALSGLTYLSGYPDRPPLNPPFALADLIAGAFGAFAIVTALYHRDARAGSGQEIDLAIYEPVFRLLEWLPIEYSKLGRVRERVGDVQEYAAPVGVYRSRDQRWIALTCSTDRTFQRLAEAMGRAELNADPRYATNVARVEHHLELDALVRGWIAGEDAQPLLDQLDATGVPVSLVYSIADIFDDPHYRAREALVDVEHPTLGRLTMQGVFPKLSETPGAVQGPAPLLGQHTDEILTSLAGYSAAEIDALRAAGAI
jgi:formyl-CoA transferase